MTAKDLFLPPFFSFGGVVDFSDDHLNRKSEGVVSSQQCRLPPPTPPTPPPPVDPTTTPKRPPPPTPTPPRPTPTPTPTTPKTTPFVKRTMGFDGSGHARLRPETLDLRRLLRSTEAGPRAANLRAELEVSTGTREGLLLWMGQREADFFGNYHGYFFALGCKYLL